MCKACSYCGSERSDQSHTGLLRTLTIPSALWEPQNSPSAAPGQLKLERLVHLPAAQRRLVRSSAAASGCGKGSAHCAAAAITASRSSDGRSAALWPSMLPRTRALLAACYPGGQLFKRSSSTQEPWTVVCDTLLGNAACNRRCADFLAKPRLVAVAN